VKRSGERVKRFPRALELWWEQIWRRHVHVHRQLSLAPWILLLGAKEQALTLSLAFLAACPILTQAEVEPFIRVFAVLLFLLSNIAPMQVKKNNNNRDNRNTTLMLAVVQVHPPLRRALRDTECNWQRQPVRADWFLAEVGIFRSASRIGGSGLYSRGHHSAQDCSR